MDLVILAVFGILSGMMVLVQSPVNTALGRNVGSPVLASFISFLTGMVFLLALCIFTGTDMSISSDGICSTPWWSYTGGICGAAIVLSFIILFSRVGAVNTVVLPLTGMLAMGAVIDQFGLFGSETYSVSALGVLGFILLAAGMVTVVTVPRHEKDGGKEKIPNEDDGNSPIWYLFGIGVGVLMASQAAINGNLGIHLDSALHSALVSFVVGTAILFAACLWKRNLHDVVLVRENRVPWWMLTGGILGAAYIFFNAYLVPEIGTGTTVVLTITGQMIGSVIIDNFGLLGTVKKKTGALQIIGLALMFAGVVMVKMS
ncbi:DMT family transporter [Methanomethylophilus alvi]|uniref:DMT family transporter n=1 Tax=Methanomethylophilus alvi TaxID=1291540 RepID=UPI0037DCA3A7